LINDGAKITKISELANFSDDYFSKNKHFFPKNEKKARKKLP